MTTVNILIEIILQLLLNWKKVSCPALVRMSFQFFPRLIPVHHYWWHQQLRFNTFLPILTEKIKLVVVELVTLLPLKPSSSQFSMQPSNHLMSIRPHPSPEWILQRLSFTLRIKSSFALCGQDIYQEPIPDLVSGHVFLTSSSSLLVLLLFSSSVMSNSLQPHGLQHARLPCPSPTPGTCSNSYPLNRWYHPIISSSVVPFSSCLQPLPASGSFPTSPFFTSGGRTIGASASVLPMNSRDWFLLELIGLI